MKKILYIIPILLLFGCAKTSETHTALTDGVILYYDLSDAGGFWWGFWYIETYI